MAKKFVCKLRYLMEAHGVTQKSLSLAIGIHVSTINRLYNNNFQRVDVNTILLIIAYFDCELSDLFEIT